MAVSLAQFGVQAAFVTKLPDNPIGQAAVNSLRRFGVDTSDIVRGGKRIGIYFMEKGASQRPSKVVYDRAGSAISEADPSEFDWEKFWPARLVPLPALRRRWARKPRPPVWRRQRPPAS